ncbi:hypothetical protein CTAYLR_007057 [Chrysophaeum taylorii]|uniref:Uncharacterized protein n=1 Tax=Chrysophaeum taylorii TaxID=2483200 RepID=A0AAD7UN35_9STRA|nr:hypothetical protein CTAYLR_007057 [Chrysophaeum taylorii]
MGGSAVNTISNNTRTELWRALRARPPHRVQQVLESQEWWENDLAWRRVRLAESSSGSVGLPVLEAWRSSSDGMKKPAILVAHCTGSGKELLKEEMARFARAGAWAVSFDGPYHGERGPGLSEPREARLGPYLDALVGAWRGSSERPFVIDGAADALRVVDYVAPNATAVAATGVSLGGMVAWLAAAADPRIAAVAPMIGVQWFEWAAANDAFEGRVDSVRRVFDAARIDSNLSRIDANVFRSVLDKIAPGLRDRFDAPATLPLIAPRPLLIANGETDPRCPMRGVAAVYLDRLVPRYAALKASRNLALYVEPGVGHVPTQGMWDIIFAWFQRHGLLETSDDTPPDPSKDISPEGYAYVFRDAAAGGAEEEEEAEGRAARSYLATSTTAAAICEGTRVMRQASLRRRRRAVELMANEDKAQGEQEMLTLLRMNLQAMYHGTNSSERRCADRFLQKLQRDSSGWGLADAILGGRTPLAPLENLSAQPLACEALLFAAMTLHVKVSGDLHELSGEQQVQLREAAIEHLRRWGRGSTPPALVKKLALAVAALAVQTSWQGALGFVEQQLGEAGRATGEDEESVVRATRARLVAVELLTALPEQCASRRLCVNRARRDAYASLLASASGGAVAAATSVVAATSADLARGSLGALATQAATRLNARCFACLQSWMCWSEIEADVLASNPLFLGAFDALWGGRADLFDVAADVVVEALRAYDCSVPSNAPLVSAVAPRVMALRPQFEAAGGDEDAALGYARVFCEMGEAYILLAIVDLEIGCAAHPSRKVAGLALRFFYKLARAWTEFDEAAKATLRPVLDEPFSRLVTICVRHARRTEDDGTADQFALDELALSEEFSRHRQDVGDALGDCASFLGSDAIVEKIGAELQRATTDPTNANDAIEACFFALKAVSEWVGDDDATVLPGAFRLLHGLPRDWAPALRTGAAMVGAYATWLKAHAHEFLEPLFSFLVAQLETTAARNAARAARQHHQHQHQHQSAPARHRPPGAGGGPSVAAKSLKAVCHVCAPQLAAVGGVLDLRDRVRPAGVALRDELEVLEGLGHVVSATDAYDALASGFERLVAPPAMALANFASASEATDPKLVVDDLERLTSIVRCATPSHKVLQTRPHPVLTAVERLWPVFEALADRYRGNPHLIERLCRCYKHSMRSCRARFEPMLDNMIQHLTRHFALAPLSSYVYASSICITEFGHDRTKERVLFEMLSAISSTVFSLLRALDDFRDRPDTVEEFFYLASRFLDYCPDELVKSPLLASILRCGVVGLALEHREAQRGVLHCFERAVVVALASHQPPRRQSDPADLERTQAIHRLLHDDGEGLGREISNGILKALTGELPAYALDDGNGSLVGVLWKLRHFCPADLPRWCAQSLLDVPDRFASNDIKQDLLNSISAHPPKKEPFCEALLVFSARCRDLAKVLR